MKRVPGLRKTRESEEFLSIWTMGIGSDRSLGRRKECNGRSSGFDDFAFKLECWSSGLLEEADASGGERLDAFAHRLRNGDEAAKHGKKCCCVAATIGWKQAAQHHSVSSREAKAKRKWNVAVNTAAREIGLLETVMEKTPIGNEDFGDWFLRWLDLVSQRQREARRRGTPSVRCNGRLVRLGLDVHFTNCNHTCWLEMLAKEPRSMRTTSTVSATLGGLTSSWKR